MGSIRQIAIDGPAGAGKSTIARRVASKLGLPYIDTGAMYRTLALHVLRQGVALEDQSAVEACAAQAPLSIEYVDGEQQMWLAGENVSGQIRREEVGNASSRIAAYGGVRAALLDMQRNLARERGCVMDGRDIASCVLPQAELKIFLTADSAVRAGRRLLELEAKAASQAKEAGAKTGLPELEDLQRDIEERDARDRSRAVSPLVQVPEARLLDSSHMDIDQVVDLILSWAGEIWP